MPEWRDRDNDAPPPRPTAHLGFQPVAVPAVTPRPPQGGTGAMDPRHAHNAAIIDRIVADKVKDAHLMRCIVQGCHAPKGGPCQYCGAVR